MRRALAALSLLLAQSAAAQEPAFPAAERLDDAALAEIRGGFVVRGFDVRFGLRVDSFVDGVPLLASDLAGARPGATLVAGGPETSQALHVLSPGHLAILSNRVDGRVLEQVVTIDVDVMNFRALTGAGQAQSALRLGEPLRAAALGGLPR